MKYFIILDAISNFKNPKDNTIYIDKDGEKIKIGILVDEEDEESDVFHRKIKFD